MGTQLPSPKGPNPQFSAHVCCSQMGGWIKMPLGTEVDLGQGDFVLDGDPAPPKRGTAPNFRPVYCGQTVAHLSYCWALVTLYHKDINWKVNLLWKETINDTDWYILMSVSVSVFAFSDWPEISRNTYHITHRVLFAEVINGLKQAAYWPVIQSHMTFTLQHLKF